MINNSWVVENQAKNCELYTWVVLIVNIYVFKQSTIK